MVDAVERMVGRLGVETVVVPIGERSDETDRHLDEAIARLHAAELVFLVDLEGSTPFNLCYRRDPQHSVVLTGMNLPMLLKLATADRTLGARHLAEELQATGKKSIHLCVHDSPSGTPTSPPTNPTAT
jgi:PTS system mannose-specific IIA component